MYRIEFTGCLTSLLIFLLILFLVKELWWVIVGVAIILIIAYYANMIYRLFADKKAEAERNYTPQMGEVYKVCPYCNSKVKVTAMTCPNCNHALN